MTTQEALDLIEQTEGAGHVLKQCVFKGLQILAKHDEKLDMLFEHDQCFVSDFEATVAKMTKEEVAELADCGWFESEGCWSHY